MAEGAGGPPRLDKIIVLVNRASGRAGPDSARVAEGILSETGVTATVVAPEPEDLEAALRKAVGDAPDLVVLIAGDGTARAAAALCGPDGPLLAPLPGGTMNMLPKALYGQATWQVALKNCFCDGEVKSIGGGEVEGQMFYVAAILGAPALWAEAREAARKGDLARMFAKTQIAIQRAFAGRLRVGIEGFPPQRTEALALICPLISKVMPDTAPALEAAELDVPGALEVFRLAFNAVAGDWRNDPAVTTHPCTHGLVWANGRIPAILDGESVRLGKAARITYRPNAFRALTFKSP